MKRIVFSLACLLAALLAHGGTVRTRDGKSYEGAVKLNAEGFAVTLADNSTVKVAFANVERATFEPFAPEPALAGATNGFLGTYFPEPDFGGQPIRRVDASLDFDWSDAPPVPNFPREKFSARWTAQLRPTTTDLYTFHVRVDDGVRLWLNERLLLDEWREQSLSAATAPVTLKASETYNLTIEYFQLTGPARIRFQWSSPTMAKTGIPAELLAPGKVLALPSLAATANIGKGVLTWNGSFIGAPVQRADDTAVVFDAPHKGFVLSTVNAARIYFRALSSSRAAKLEPKRPGVLLINGDFIDGEFKGIADGRVQITSVLFGLKSYDINYEALAVTLRDPVTAQAQFLVRSRAGGALLAQSVAVKDGALEVTGAPVTGLRIAETDLEEFKSGTGTNLWDEVVTKILIRESAADRPTSTDLAGARRVRDEGERMARAAADVRNRAEEKARSETDALARAQTDLEKKSRLAAEAKIAVDATTAEKAKHEKTYNDAKLVAERATNDFNEKSKLASAAKSEAIRASQEIESKQRSAREARAHLDRIASVINTGRAQLEAKLNSEKQNAERMAADAALRARRTGEEKAVAEKAFAKAAADRDAVEKSSAAAKASAEKSVTETSARMKALSEAKANTDQTAAKLASAVAKIAAEKGVNSPDAQKAKAEADKAAADAASLSRLLDDAKKAASTAQQAKTATDNKASSDKTSGKGTLTRAQQEFDSKSKAAAEAMTSSEKAAAHLASVLAKIKTEKEAFEAKAAASKAEAEKKIAEADAAVKIAMATKADADKRTSEAFAAADKVQREKSAATQSAAQARAVFDRAAGDAAGKLRIATATEAERAAAEAYAAAKAEAAKRAQLELK